MTEPNPVEKVETAPILHKWDTVNWDARLAEESKKLMDCEVRLRCLGVVQENGSVYMTNYNIFRFLQSVYQPYGERDPYIENYYYMGCQNRLNHMISLRTYGSLKGQEHTLESDVRSSTGLLVELYRVVLDLEQRILAKGFRGSTLTLKIKYADFTVRTKSASVSEALVERGRILSTAKKLLAQAEEQMPAGAAVRLLGLSVSHASADSPVCYVRQLKFDF